MRTLVWHGLDLPRMEIAHVESLERATGTQIGGRYELRWRLEGERLDLELVGQERATLELGDADYFDVAFSPFFNSLPVVHDGLLERGPARDYVMRFVSVPDLTISASPQLYEPFGDGVVRYSSGAFTADIEFDADGFVVHYHGLCKRVD